jgi:hypothetical protein
MNRTLELGNTQITAQGLLPKEDLQPDQHQRFQGIIMEEVEKIFHDFSRYGNYKSLMRKFSKSK